MTGRAKEELIAAWTEVDERRSMGKRELREILGLTRVLLEQQQDPRRQFPALYLYCDWAAHWDIDRNATAREVLDAVSRSFSTPTQSGVNDPHAYFTAALQAIAPRQLRREWLDFHATHDITAEALNGYSTWKCICTALFEALLDRPIYLGPVRGDGLPDNPTNRRLYEAMLQRSNGEPRLVPTSIKLDGPLAADIDKLAAHLDSRLRAHIAGHAWAIQTVPDTVVRIAILDDEAASAFSHA